MKSKNGFCTSLMAFPNGNLNALARPNDSMTSTASVELRQRWSFLFKDLELACALRDFCVRFFLLTRHVWTQGTEARCAQVCEKQGFSLNEKCGLWPEREMCPTIARERFDVPHHTFTRYTFTRYSVHSDKPIVQNFEFLAINRYYVIFECVRTLRYSDTSILRNFEYFCKN